ncbi:MAG: TRAP transporter, DctM subunit, partial [bacterium 42_11]
MGVLGLILGKLFSPFPLHYAMGEVAWAGSTDFVLFAIPLFILAGDIMTKGKISERLFDFFVYFLGKVRAGMLMATIATAMFYGAISGSGVATTAAVGSMAIPFLAGLGYDRTFVAGMIATAGGLGVIIPPSIPFVTYGVVTGTSIGDLFIGGIFPGIVIGICLMGYAFIYALTKGEDRATILARYHDLRSRGFLRVVGESFWALLSPIIVLGGIYSGIVTPTEAAVVSVFYSFLVCVLIYKTLRLTDIPKILVSSVRAYTPIVMLLSLAIVFGRVLTLLQVPQAVRDFIITNFGGSPALFLFGLNVLFLIIGMFMDIGPVIAILAPMLLPAALALGIDPVHLGIIMSINLAVGMATPPFGVNLFVAAPLIEKPVMDVGKQAIPFILAFIVALLLITYIPEISLI